ncbi:MAG TPA: aminofutalosine synthase MqnE [Tenuifilaceae bacterium]|nr:aminofutalosine synthase MqnE [Tenuifilaceae bacterium]HPE18960.1 aminofutalosine synthase MqnE [Tenuifilaceae bacterium]HPJ46364.1 aminofutalosine synthase MqnE [Tenuifilaceae bacterium]HPQ34824.1 aminofutalosine synthase MqnE [Tenuifilaceae bacterium]
MEFTEASTPSDLLKGRIENSKLKTIAEKVFNGIRISAEDALILYNQAELGFLGLLASFVARKNNGNDVFFNRNFHIEPTNICIHSCAFCSYRRRVGEEGSWEMTLEQIRETVRSFRPKGVTEVHITGGVHPRWTIDYFGKIISTIKSEMPTLHIKAFSAVELDFIFQQAKLSPREGIKRMRAFGLDSIPGGGAEIANSEIRQKICGEKTSWERWLEIHEAAHQEGLTSNATMLYGHIETYQHRIEHMEAIRKLQDRTKGFNCFIPLKFKASQNKLEYIGEVNLVEDFRNFAVSRLFLDNVKNLKAYWPMLGKQAAQLAIAFGVNDLDGTIDDSTKIYSMAGAEDKNPSITIENLCATIRSMGKNPVERDSLYNPIKRY